MENLSWGFRCVSESRVTFNTSLLYELGACTDTCFLKFLLWHILLDGVLDAFPLCLWCMWLLMLHVLMKCNSVGLLW
jgi:hypothetical protein